MGLHALKMGPLEAANQPWFAEVNDRDSTRRAVVELLKRVPVLRAKTVGIKTESRKGGIGHPVILCRIRGLMKAIANCEPRTANCE